MSGIHLIPPREAAPKIIAHDGSGERFRSGARRGVGFGGARRKPKPDARAVLEGLDARELAMRGGSASARG